MKREISIFLILFILLVVVGCVQRNFEQPKTGDEVLSQIVPVAIKVDSITNETLDELRAQGLVISDTEQSKTYGNVIFGTINQSKVGDLGKNVQEGVTEKEYKKEVLTEIAKESGEHWVESPREFGFMVDSQIAADERKKELGIKGPLVDEATLEQFQNEEMVRVFMNFNIQDWKNWESYTNEIISDLGDDIEVQEANSRGIDAYVSRDGLEKLMEKRYLRRIGYILSNDS
ncbi:TPA: hypothetical protein HA242_04335 [Candidatus Woesearchaeota archaeon]|nr:hypothetical protein [Candidatus Woesearchaeota archaeon]HIH12927.1 hypothetical protein [Candidatus Woesearchaeota archaeon]